MNEWEANYVFKAPFSGVIQFLGFWSDGEFISKGEELFSIIPSDDKYYGQVLLSENSGAGKVEIGQSVIIKLKDFPYLEFGYVRGVVASISLATNVEQTSSGKVGYYMIFVKLESGLRTNYGKKLTYKHGISGSVEIITQRRRLFERLFDNIKYLKHE
ncbi:HlyD family efflux transporter periplasmic adaptor subunit [Arachidicoccus ginsenosidivorans]|uniref:HlyD family efflux transporter periplasmic adaptor subunit n=1 Tax=Arachidicoccus ginsenosidivorans TaxID=496057 RepID=A0A5B8VNG2_9BACT|nr:HlyD family efflux transporter periplasmic adaptor subunit [Arachidicoccus ginsenosidivorans]QEC72186.1 HlyD family efflux transporter periplasmic adaptor subunit [Arachidicoccus ginsenosidivorans]